MIESESSLFLSGFAPLIEKGMAYYVLYINRVLCSWLMKMVTTKRAQKLLEERGINVSYPTIAQWVREGRFAGAVRDETERGPVWRIPLESVKRFELPKMGRPPKPETETTSRKRAISRWEGEGGVVLPKPRAETTKKKGSKN